LPLLKFQPSYECNVILSAYTSIRKMTWRFSAEDVVAPITVYCRLEGTDGNVSGLHFDIRSPNIPTKHCAL